MSSILMLLSILRVPEVRSGTFVYIDRLVSLEAPWYMFGIIYADALEYVIRLYVEVNSLIYCIVGGIVFFVGILVVRKAAWCAIVRTLTVARVIVLELFFMLLPTLCIVYILVPTLAHIYRTTNDAVGIAVIVEFVGRQWYWIARETYTSVVEVCETMFGQVVSYSEYMYVIGTETPVIIPVQVPVLLRISSGDVIHALAFPALGIKIDAIPGQVQECIVQALHVGTYRGQCAELCGVLHGKMPLELRAMRVCGSTTLRALNYITVQRMCCAYSGCSTVWI